MQRYWWPGYEMQLIGELQRQQNNTQCCDTLLQTDGISVPVHSCILAALSPFLSQKLSASPSPPSGQKRLLQLQPVKAQTLLKLVGLLYSGEVEVKGSVEQNDMLAVAHLFGIRDIVEGHKNGKIEGELQKKLQLLGSSKQARGSDGKESRKMQDAQVQTEMSGRRDMDSSVENRNCVTTGTQTGEKSVGNCISCLSQAPTPECAPAVGQNVNFCSMLQPQNITLDEQFSYTTCPVVPSTTSGPWNHAKSSLHQSSSSIINLNSPLLLSNNMVTFSLSLNGDTNSPTSPEDSTYQQFSNYGICLQALSKKSTGPENGKTSEHIPDSRENTEEPWQASRDGLLREENGTSTEKSHPRSNIGRKNLANMKQMQQMLETTQISIKVKLRRRTEEVWEVVSPQDTESLSPLFSYKRDGSNYKGLQAKPPSTVEPDNLNLEPRPKTSCGCQLPSCDNFNPYQRNDLGTTTCLQTKGTVEEPDEQIEKLLEEIMNGLNILPILEKECKKSHYLQPSHAVIPTVGQVPVTQNNERHSQMHAADVPGCTFCQDIGTQSGHSGSETGIYTRKAQNQPDTVLPVVQPDAVLIQQQLQCSSQCHSSVRYTGHRDGTSCASMPLSKSQECLLPGEPTTKPVLASAAFSASQKHHLTLQESPRQDNQHILEYFPTVTDIETQSLHTVSLPCMDDLRIPRCLSPLDACTSATKHQALLNQVNISDTTQQKSLLHGRPWLTENPGSLQFPLSAITFMKNKTAFLQDDTNCGLNHKQEEQHDLNPQNEGTLVESCTVKQVEEREIISGGQQDGAELKFEPRKMKKCLKCKNGDTSEAAVVPKKKKRMYTSFSQDAVSCSAYKDVWVSDGTKGKIHLSHCLVSLSCNNVLVKERERANNIPSRFIRESNQLSSTAENLRGKTKGTIVKTEKNRIRTRGFMKKTQESQSCINPPNSSVPISVSCRAEIVNNKDPFPRRKRGKPPKAKVEELTPPNINNPTVIEKSFSSEHQEQLHKNLSKEDLEQMEKTKKCKKKKMGGSTEVEAKTMSTEITAKMDVINNNIMPAVKRLEKPRRPQMVTLKGLQRLLSLQCLKTRKSKESKETNGRDVESEGTTRGDRILKELCKENHCVFNQSAAETSQQNSTNCSHTSLFGHNPELADEREQLSKNPDEGNLYDASALNKTQETDVKNRGSTDIDSHLPQEGRLVSDHICSKTADGTPPRLPDVGGISRTSDCNQEKEAEELEVDVLHVTPDRATEYENGSQNIEITPDEEDEVEDMIEIDVTGDETE